MSNVTSVSAAKSNKPKKTAVKVLAYVFLIAQFLQELFRKEPC